MKLSVLGSGSKGNTTYIELENTKVLIDSGLSFRQTNKRLEDINLNLDSLDGVLITHEHSDHIAGLNVLLKKVPTTCFLTEETFLSFHYKQSENIQESQLHFIEPHQEFMIGNIKIYPISVSHDSSDAVGYILYGEGKKIVYITDTGYLPKKDHDILRNADAYIFESNYDVTLLFTSNRPFYLKQRIDGVKGHMSNTDSAYNLSQIVGDKTKHIILAHPSRECNTPKHASDTLKEVFSDYGLTVSDYNIMVASQDIPTTVIEED